jgi:hypothetical protein
MIDYKEFIEGKILTTPVTGFNVLRHEIDARLFEYQKDTVMWSAAGGRRAVFKKFGMGKTWDQLELMRLCLLKNASLEKRVLGLIVCPLGVRHEFKKVAASQ